MTNRLTVCVLYVYCMCTVCVLYVYCMCTVCVLYVYCMCTVCALYGIVIVHVCCFICDNQDGFLIKCGTSFLLASPQLHTFVCVKLCQIH